MTNFSGFNSAVSALQTHQKVLEVVGHNIANVNTEGYSRRNVDLKTSGLGAVSAIWSPYTGRGEGVEIGSILRVRDGFLEDRAQTAFANNGYAFRSSQILAQVEQSFPEPSDNGISAQLAGFWSAFDDAANQPESIPARAQVLENATSLAATLSRTAQELKGQQTSTINGAHTMIAQVNSIAKEVANLNGQIRKATATGLGNHDLSDQRDALVEQLSALTGAIPREGEYGTVNVYLGGSPLVNDSSSNNLKLAVGQTLDSPLDATGLTGVAVHWESGDYPATVTSGELAGLTMGVNNYIPRYLSELDGMVSNLVTAVNGLHVTGQGLDEINDVALNFFDPAGVTASTIALSADVAGQPSRIALAAAGSGQLDSTIGQALAALTTSPTGPDAMYAQMVGELGVEVAAADQHALTAQNLALSADAQRKDISGVNLDEEMSKLISTQRAYEAAARLLTTIDELMDTLINRTGLVGR